MLSKGLRDEENEKIDRLFNEALNIEYVPELYVKQQRELISRLILETTGFTLSEFAEAENEELYENLQERKLPFSNCEQLGDLLLRIFSFEEDDLQLKLLQKTVALYEYVQTESKIFSFTIVQKLNSVKTQIENLK